MLSVGMDKPALLLSLADVREKAVQANLDLVVQTHRVSSLKSKGLDATGASIILRCCVNAEQKLLKEMDWLLDQLEQLNRTQPIPSPSHLVELLEIPSRLRRRFTKSSRDSSNTSSTSQLAISLRY
jgi:hypothetical protein